MSFPAYERYKDSGVEWLGEMPEHWAVTRLGTLCSKIGSGKTPFGGADNYHSEGVLFLRSQNVYDEGLHLDDVVYISAETDSDMLGTRVVPGDILLNITGASLGRTCLVPEDFRPANVNQHVCIVRLGDPKSRQFVAMAMKSLSVKAQIDAAQNGAARDGLNFEQIGKIVLALPPLGERAAIAAFLDRETAKIDALVEEQKRLIGLLKEKRRAVVSHAVTKGLDPNVPMKDSGVEWLDEVPEHWELGKFSREVWIAEGQVDPEIEPFASMLLVAPNHIESGTGRLIERASAAEQGAESGKYRCQQGNVIYSKIRPALAKVTLAPEDCLCSADMYPLEGKGRLANPYLRWVLLSSRFTAWSVLEADRVAMPKINRETLSELRLPVPPLEEQWSINEYLARETEALDALANESERVTSILLERRSALISAAVTGKIDVRGLVEPERVWPPEHQAVLPNLRSPRSHAGAVDQVVEPA
jgi:type I restriction enzyme, S subunit